MWYRDTKRMRLQSPLWTRTSCISIFTTLVIILSYYVILVIICYSNVIYYSLRDYYVFKHCCVIMYYVLFYYLFMLLSIKYSLFMVMSIYPNRASYPPWVDLCWLSVEYMSELMCVWVSSNATYQFLNKNAVLKIQSFQLEFFQVQSFQFQTFQVDFQALLCFWMANNFILNMFYVKRLLLSTNTHLALKSFFFLQW